ncbi:hypothetical protein [Streptomyces atroolivaceus]|uniref:hypothetical protein n=1 Tax=Streptomyces atroolivaceus TaxID=66869 RepID=UPI0020255C3B|nr:hypothetical protein [Streptomyces atroolivaceus]
MTRVRTWKGHFSLPEKIRLCLIFHLAHEHPHADADIMRHSSGWHREQVAAAAKAELAHLQGLLVLPGSVPRLPAGRLKDQSEETGGRGLGHRPVRVADPARPGAAAVLPGPALRRQGPKWQEFAPASNPPRRPQRPWLRDP